MWHEYWNLILLAILVIPLVGVAAFGLWLRKRADIDLEKGVKCWDVFIKLVSALTIVVSGAMVFGRYIDQQQMVESQKIGQQKAVEGGKIEQQKRELDVKKAEFLRQKLQFDTERHQRRRALFEEAKTIAARLANADNTDRVIMLRFDEMYHATLIGVEEPGGEVEKAMVRFRNKLRRVSDAPEDSLDQLSLQLSVACERELKTSEELLLEQHRDILNLLDINKQIISKK